MNAILRNFAIAAAIAAAFLIWTFAGRRQGPMPTRGTPPAYRDFEGTDHLTSVAILRFYTSSGILQEGDKATICYGVAKAKTVRLDPPVEQLSPSLNRCFQVAPEEDTRYTLIAEGEDGRTVSESFTVHVKPDPQTLPRVIYFMSRNTGDAGVNSLCFAVENAARVSVEPPVFPPMERSPRGCFYVAPKQTTTYTLTAAGAHGKTAIRRVTVQR